MDQVVRGSEEEPFLELLHPRGPPVSSPAGEAEAAGGEARESHGHGGEGEMVPNFDFQPIRSTSSTSSVDAGMKTQHTSSPPSDKGAVLSSPLEHKIYPSSEQAQAVEHAKSKQEREVFHSATVGAVERTMKKYTDNIFYVLEGMGGRLSLLETNTKSLGHSVNELNIVEVENYDQVTGRLERLESLLKEVQSRVQLLHDQQELAVRESQLLKLQLGDGGKAAFGAELTRTQVADSWQQPKGEVPPHHPVSAPLSSQPPLQHPQAPLPTQQPVLLAQASQPQALTGSQQLLPSPVGMNVLSEPSTSTIQQPFATSQQPIPPHLQPPSHPMPMPPYYSQALQHQSPYSQQQVEAAPYGIQAALGHHAPATPPSSNYVPEPLQYMPGKFDGLRPPIVPHQQPLHSPQEHLTSGAQRTYEPQAGRMGSTSNGLQLPYVQLPQSLAPASMYEAPSGVNAAPSYRVAQPLPSAPSGGYGYPRPPPPMAQQLQQHASPAPGGASPTTNRVSIEEVIQKVAAMGFSREQVKAVVMRLTENGQSVDLNVVLDKLMNGGGGFQPPGDQFNR